MSDRHFLQLRFGPQIELTVRKRIDYAFRVFCAVYGFTPVESGHAPALGYGVEATVTLSAPGWLDEIFEWISGAHESSVTETDSVGRIAYRATVHAKRQLDPLVPYAAVAMRELNDRIRAAVGDGWPARPTNPWLPAHACAIAATHDVDFLPVGVLPSAHRRMKDFSIAAFLHCDPKLAARILGSALTEDRSLLDTLEREGQLGIRSTYNMLVRRAHRRDATYDINDPKVRVLLNRLVEAGNEIGLHGSYTSLEAKGRLAEEYRTLRNAGYAVVGGRQHWLRYRAPGGLIAELCAADAWYDCTFGYRARPGFRNGACFPFPPYDFNGERAFPVLELPLVIMDTTLDELHRNGEDVRQLSRQVLSAVREYGWGGTSILWHDTTFGHAAMSPEVGELYWQLKETGDRWMPAAELVKAIWPRYVAAGLLPAMKS